VDSGLDAGATYYYVVSAVNSAGESGNSPEASVTFGGALPSPWAQGDVGSVGMPGSAAYSNGTFTIEGSGSDIGGKSDEFHYVWQTASGDCSIIARVADIENTDPAAKAGIMIRESSSSSRSIFAGLFITPGNGLLFEYRTSTGRPTNISATSLQAPTWLKLTRTGSNLNAFYSADGVSWTQFGRSRNFYMSANASIGLAVGSHTDAALCAANFDSVTVSP